VFGNDKGWKKNVTAILKEKVAEFLCKDACRQTLL